MAIVTLGLLKLRPLQRWLESFYSDPKWDKHKKLRVPSVEYTCQGYRTKSQTSSPIRKKTLPREWRLPLEVVQNIWGLCRAEVDLFASETSTHSPLWFSHDREHKTSGPGCSGSQVARVFSLRLSSIYFSNTAQGALLGS